MPKKWAPKMGSNNGMLFDVEQAFVIITTMYVVSKLVIIALHSSDLRTDAMFRASRRTL
jgi:hypothetical protein